MKQNDDDPTLPPPSDGAIRLMRAADPAGKLVPLAPWQVAQLTQRAITRAERPTVANPHRARRFVIPGVASFGAAAIVGGISLLSLGGTAVTTLSAPPGAGLASDCAPVTADSLSSSELAFRGTVEKTEGSTVTLRVDSVYAGDPENQIEILQGNVDAALDGALPEFNNGQTYLVAAHDGVVSSCGLTGVDSPELAALYDAAFLR